MCPNACDCARERQADACQDVCASQHEPRRHSASLRALGLWGAIEGSATQLLPASGSQHGVASRSCEQSADATALCHTARHLPAPDLGMTASDRLSCRAEQQRFRHILMDLRCLQCQWQRHCCSAVAHLSSELKQIKRQRSPAHRPWHSSCGICLIQTRDMHSKLIKQLLHVRRQRRGARCSSLPN